jgi:hypothetical protein
VTIRASVVLRGPGVIVACGETALVRAGGDASAT